MEEFKADVRRILEWHVNERRRLHDAMMMEVRRIIGAFFDANPAARSIWWQQGYDRYPAEMGGIFIVGSVVFLDRPAMLDGIPRGLDDDEIQEHLDRDEGTFFCYEDPIEAGRDKRLKFSIDHAASIHALLTSEEMSGVLLHAFGEGTIRARCADAGRQGEPSMALIEIAPEGLWLPGQGPASNSDR
jgi:hypothetical protein